jgi:large subunit ribosomal protein L4
MCSALTAKAQNGRVRVIADFSLPAPSTREFAKVLAACGVREEKVLFITAAHEPVLYKSSRNIPSVTMAQLGTLGAYDVIAAETVVFTRSSLAQLSERAEARDAGQGEVRSVDE